ncbi:MFS transporter [Streptomyces lutosisoli]|uniref:MFS transporter n=1 Tax=Streptomyces lutosisoli TaxID=2665721 RepID=A0ABW2VGR6_9ACTN
MSSEAPPQNATAREWLGLAVLALPAMIVMMDMTLLFLATPHLTAAMHPSGTQLLWITDIYGFLSAGFLITMGTLGERIGRRNLLLIGAAFFGAASALTAYASSPEMLIVTRAVLGVAGATLAPSTLALLRNMFHNPKQRTMAITLWMMASMIGGSVGPVVGGLMLQHFWWGSVFLLAVPIMLLLLIAGPMLLPEFRNPNADRVDPLSVVLSLAAILPVIYGIKQLAQDGYDTVPAACIVIGLVAGVLFVLRQRSLTTPLVDLGLFANRTFSASLTALTIAVVFLMGIQYLVAQYLQDALGYSPLDAGLWMLPAIFLGIFAAITASGLGAKLRPGVVLSIGLLVAAAGFVVLTTLDGNSGVAPVVTGSVLMFVGLAPVTALGTDLIVGAAPAERSGAASALSETSQQLGGSLGIALLGVIGTVVYRSRLDDTLPTGLSADAVQSARQNPSNAMAIAEHLTDGRALADAAKGAFAHALSVDALVAAPVIVVLAASVFWTLRAVLPTGAKQEQEKEEPQVRIQEREVELDSLA